jgi:hypothetical protein
VGGKPLNFSSACAKQNRTPPNQCLKKFDWWPRRFSRIHGVLCMTLESKIQKDVLPKQLVWARIVCSRYVADSKYIWSVWQPLPLC